MATWYLRLPHFLFLAIYLLENIYHFQTYIVFKKIHTFGISEICQFRTIENRRVSLKLNQVVNNCNSGVQVIWQLDFHQVASIFGKLGLATSAVLDRYWFTNEKLLESNFVYICTWGWSQTNQLWIIAIWSALIWWL